jgi:carbonic anhydrase
MSTQTNKKPTPMNISPQNVVGTCNYKCALSFDYPVSSCTATNSGNYVTLSFTDSTSPVMFNKNKYNLSESFIYSPSLHSYNNMQADAEICIALTPTEGGNQLYICIPISTNGTSNNASNILSEIIQAVANGAPSQGGSVSQGINDFTLNDFIPIREFYNYTSIDGRTDFIAFGSQNAVYISQSNLTSLQKVIKPVDGIAFPSGPSLFLNPDGPTKGDGITSDNIYIDCQPTNSSEEETNEVVDLKANTNYDVGTTFTDILFNPIFLMFLFAFVFVIIIMLIHKGLVVLTGGSGGE